jgi:hypothetical protein
VDSLLATWPGLEKANVRDISKQNCLDWSARYEGSSAAFNNTALVLRAVLDIAIESGVIYENMARHVTRRAVRPKELDLPDNDKFAEFVRAIENGGGRFSRDGADLVRFLAYGGFRLGKAKKSPGPTAILDERKSLCAATRTEAPKTAKAAAFPSSRKCANSLNGFARSVPTNRQMPA